MKTIKSALVEKGHKDLAKELLALGEENLLNKEYDPMLPLADELDNTKKDGVAPDEDDDLMHPFYDFVPLEDLPRKFPGKSKFAKSILTAATELEKLGRLDLAEDLRTLKFPVPKEKKA